MSSTITIHLQTSRTLTRRSPQLFYLSHNLFFIGLADDWSVNHNHPLLMSESDRAMSVDWKHPLLVSEHNWASTAPVVEVTDGDQIWARGQRWVHTSIYLSICLYIHISRVFQADDIDLSFSLTKTHSSIYQIFLHYFGCFTFQGLVHFY